ncbi:hypothetical protein VHEMI09385 [[Torrubiella] hemipterigena]|uniref:Ribosome biogenesis protein SLX9 n=1 Tax=[Torrubiella] hemipterigena TaxID=1531966 RepID=A0A0A1TRE8_9HYPO|nr:hypothetical protein VHEMI09385 [[Torrubiella] hemipterigena]
MAPLPPGLRKPSARSLRTQRITGQIHHLAPDKVFRDDAAVTDDFISSKKDKRLIKHSTFMSRVASSAGVTKSKKRTGRGRSKQLKTNLESLADALPELESGMGGEEILAGKIKHKSLRSKKGALKRKEQVVKGEMERFGVSMAKLSETSTQATSKAASEPAATGGNASSSRWAALRGYISATMDQNPAFVGK